MKSHFDIRESYVLKLKGLSLISFYSSFFRSEGQRLFNELLNSIRYFAFTKSSHRAVSVTTSQRDSEWLHSFSIPLFSWTTLNYCWIFALYGVFRWRLNTTLGKKPLPSLVLPFWPRCLSRSLCCMICSASLLGFVACMQ